MGTMLLWVEQYMADLIVEFCSTVTYFPRSLVSLLRWWFLFSLSLSFTLSVSHSLCLSLSLSLFLIWARKNVAVFVAYQWQLTIKERGCRKNARWLWCYSQLHHEAVQTWSQGKFLLLVVNYMHEDPQWCCFLRSNRIRFILSQFLDLKHQTANFENTNYCWLNPLNAFWVFLLCTCFQMPVAD